MPCNEANTEELCVDGEEGEAEALLEFGGALVGAFGAADEAGEFEVVEGVVDEAAAGFGGVGRHWTHEPGRVGIDYTPRFPGRTCLQKMAYFIGFLIRSNKTPVELFVGSLDGLTSFFAQKYGFIALMKILRAIGTTFHSTSPTPPVCPAFARQQSRAVASAWASISWLPNCIPSRMTPRSTYRSPSRTIQASPDAS